MQEQKDPRSIVDDSPMAYQDLTQKPGEQPPSDNVKDLAEKAQTKAAELGDKAQDRADAGIDKAAEGLESAAQKLKEKSSSAEGMPAMTSRCSSKSTLCRLSQARWSAAS